MERVNVYRLLNKFVRQMIKLFVVSIILMPVCAISQEEKFPKEYEQHWIEIMPDIYVGPKGIGVPGASGSFWREIRPELSGLARDEVISRGLEHLTYKPLNSSE